MKFRTIFFLSLILTPSTAWAQPPSHIPEPQLVRRVTSSGNSEVGLGFFLGAGDYPIISMPLMENVDGRVDGSQFQDDVRHNRGSSLGLNLNWRSKKNSYPISVAGQWLRVATAPGTGIPTPASYSRLSLELSSSLGTGLPYITIEPAAEARRSMYLNVDSGHYIDSIHLKTKLVSRLRANLTLDVFYSYAPWTKFGLLQSDNSAASGALSGATTTVNEFGTSLTWSTNGHTDLILAFANERSIVDLDGTEGYMAYGLPVTSDPTLNGPRNFQLNMRQVVIGTQKRF